tara:strand:- start:767 stop:1576 length:810 start_codon:yes stop_codon:yes gene_type:complete
MSSTSAFVITNTHNSETRKSNVFDPKKLIFSDVKTVGKTNPRRTVYTKYDRYNKFHIQSPPMKLPYSVSSNSFDNGPPKYSATLSFNDMSDKKQKNFHEFIKQIDETMISNVLDNESVSQKWFSTKHKHREVVETLYNPMLKVDKDDNGEPTGKWPDNIKIKLPFYKKPEEDEGKFAFSLFDHNTKEEINQEDIVKSLEKGSVVRFLIECTGVYFISKNMYGLSWKVIQGSVVRPEKISGYCMVDDEVEDRELVEDSDEENDIELVNTD